MVAVVAVAVAVAVELVVSAANSSQLEHILPVGPWKMIL